MNTLPFPPAPEPGWYADDFSATESAEAAEDTDTIGGWDGTVLASSFTIRQPRTTYLLHNDATGQSITIDRSALLGRKPSETIPEGARAVTVQDPTNTISRNHAAISVDTAGQLWIEDYGSLNGTFIIRDGKESQVAGAPARLDAPATLRFADQFLELTVQQD